MSKPIKGVLNEDEDSSNYMNELTFISAQPKQETTKEVLNGTTMGRSAGQKTEHPADELAFISQGFSKDDNSEDVGLRKHEINGENLVDELKFVSHLDKSDNDEKKSHTYQDGQNSGGELNQSLSDDLVFLSNSTLPEKAQANTNNSGAHEMGGNLADELAFISQDSPKEEEIEDAGSKRNEDNLVDELNFVSQLDTSVDEPVQETIKIEKTTQENLVDELQFLSNSPTKRKNGEELLSNNNVQKKRKKKQKQKVQFNIDSSISTETKSNGSNGMSTTSNLSTDQKNPSPIKHITAVFVFSYIAVLMTFANLRIGLRLFCPYDDELGTFIVMEKVEQCPVRILNEQEDDHCDESFWRKEHEKDEEDLFDYVPAPAGKRHEILCRGTFNVLHAVAELLHPTVHYKITMPQVHTHSPCPPISKPEKKSKKKHPLKKFMSKIACIFRKKAEQIELSVEEPSVDKFDWTFFVSAPLDFNLTSKQLALAKKVAENVQKNPKLLNQESSFEEIMEQVKFGGKHSWWFPEKDDWDKDMEFSGLRLIAAYMKIMDWPENLVTNFPGSGICSEGCPADFAITNTLEFREKYQPWKITPSALNENQLGWVYVRGYSPTRHHTDPAVGGASILWLRPGLFKMQNPEAFNRAILNALDMCVADTFSRSGGKIGKCNVVLDCDDVGFSKIPPIGPTKTLLKKMQDNYPDKLGVFVIANVSGAAQMFLKLVLPLLPQVVRQKIHILPNDDEQRDAMLKELVHDDFIPTRLGGKDDYKFDAEKYYKTGQYEAESMSDTEGVEYYETMPYYAT